MGLKTNKATNTSRLKCQYVGSFPVKDGERKLTSSERNTFVVEKLKSCKKKLLDGMPVCLEVSPDGVKVFAEDEKTVKMGHPLRRISYATAETSNKLFAYVSHQRSADMEIVCHTFLTRKKDHAEGLSAVLGKLFKQTFAYTLKRRDKLEEVAEKRGNNRRWAKQQVSEGHSVARNANRRTGAGETASEPRRQDPAVAPQQGPARSARTSAEPRSATAPNPSSPTRTYPTNGVPGSLPNQSRAARAADPSEGRMAPSSGPSSPRREIPSSPTQRSPVSEVPPPLPKRNSGMDTTRSLPNQGTMDQHWTNEPCSPTKRESPSSPTRSDPSNVASPRSPIKRNVSDADIGLRSMGRRQSEAGGVLGGPSEEECRATRKFSAPPDLFPPPLPPPNGNGKPWKSSSAYMEEVTPTWLDANARDSKSLQAAASALLASAGDTPPPLPRRRGDSVDRRETPSVVREDVVDLDEDDRLRRTVTAEPRVSLTLEDEDWYIPGVSREIVIEMLATSDLGTFFVRDSQSQLGCYALTMKVVKGPNNPSGFGNYLIVPMEDGFTLQGFDTVFEDISTLIRHHSSHEDGLPCRLVLAGSNPLFHDANGYLVEFMDEEDETYATLSNCTSMFKELQMSGNTPW